MEVQKLTTNDVSRIQNSKMFIVLAFLVVRGWEDKGQVKHPRTKENCHLIQKDEKQLFLIPVIGDPFHLSVWDNDKVLSYINFLGMLMIDELNSTFPNQTAEEFFQQF